MATPQMESRPWRIVIAPEQASVARVIAAQLAGQLHTRECVEAAVATAQQQTKMERADPWPPYGIAQGWAGLAVMYGYLDACFPEAGWDRVAHDYLELAARGSQSRGYLPTGLWSGMSGLAYAAAYLSRQGTRYRKLLLAIDEVLLPRIIDQAEHLLAQEYGVSVWLYDLISGLAGVGGYLLTRRNEGNALAALRQVLISLVALTGKTAGIPRWHSPSHLLDKLMLEQFPEGNLNCGLAHGIPGPLAVLSLAHRAEIEVPGLAEAIDQVAKWLIANHLEDAWGVNWPSAVPIQTSSNENVPVRSRSGWCYGGAGVARSLWLAGQALNTPEYSSFAIEAMRAIYRRPVFERRVDSPTFCHGVAGLLQVTLRFAHDTEMPIFVDAARSLTTQLLVLHEPETALGYRSLETEGRRVEQPGLLDGAPGVALTLLAASTGARPTWDRLFLLS